MARYRGPVCRICRREGVKLYLKGTRCYTDKCALVRRNYPPGEHGQAAKPRLSAYGLRLREKQKLKAIYGILERQFRRYYKLAEKMKGMTSLNLLQILERRLDNIVYRLGFCVSRRQARQLVRHGHFLVDGKKVDIPSYLVKVGSTISVREKSRDLPPIKAALQAAQGQNLAGWLSLDKEKMEGKLLRVPTREEIPIPVNEQLIVELYSK